MKSPIKLAQFKGDDTANYREGSWTEPKMFGKKITNGVWAPSEIDALRAAAKQHGLLLVPVEPSEEMCKKGVDAYYASSIRCTNLDEMSIIYKVMIAATVEGG